MVRVCLFVVLLHVAVAHADPSSDAADAPVPLSHVASEEAHDPYELPLVRADGGLGASLGDGPAAFSARGHVGVSWWHLGNELVPGDGWHVGLRLSAGFALGVDVRATHQYYTAAPFGEIGLAFAQAHDDDHHAKQVTLFTRVEPVLMPGALGEQAARIGVGVTMHGIGPIGLGECAWSSSSDDRDLCDFGHAFGYLFGAPLFAVLNARDFEIATDLGSDGKRQYAFLLGFGV